MLQVIYMQWKGLGWLLYTVLFSHNWNQCASPHSTVRTLHMCHQIDVSGSQTRYASLHSTDILISPFPTISPPTVLNHFCGTIVSTLGRKWNSLCLSGWYQDLLLLSQHTIQTLIRLNEQLLQWKILTPFMYFELTIICISTSLTVSSAVHAHGHSRVCHHVVYFAWHSRCNCEKHKQP